MKLELKHLAGYLPYGLKIKLYGIACELEGIDLYKKNTLIAERVNHTFLEIKPILRPLSDLTKEIEVNGEKFVPMDKIAIYGDIDYLIEQIKTGMVEVIVWKMLLEWHFDIYGLIENGLAIDKNKL